MIDRARSMLAAANAWVDARRWARIVRLSVTGFFVHEVMRYAGSMAYFAILSLAQLLVLGIVVASFFLGEGPARDLLIDRLVADTPFDAVAIGGVIDATIASRGGATFIGVVFLIWASLGIFNAVSHGVARVFDTAPRRGFPGEQLMGLVLMGLTGALALAALVIGVVVGILDRMAAELPASAAGDVVVWAAGTLLPILLVGCAFAFLYRLVPNRPVTWAQAWTGAALATVAWTVLRIGFTWYATRIADYQGAFGPISTAITLLVFLYFGSIVVLAGAEVVRAVALEADRDRRLAGGGA